MRKVFIIRWRDTKNKIHESKICAINRKKAENTLFNQRKPESIIGVRHSLGAICSKENKILR